MFEFGPILRTLLRNKTGALLIIVQAALTLAIVSNAAFVVNERQQIITRPTGIDEANLFTLSFSGMANQPMSYQDVQRDLDEIRQLPGIVDASFGNTSPLSNAGSSGDITNNDDPAKPVSVLADQFSTDSHGLNTLGLTLIAGRFFNDAEMQVVSSVIGNNSELSGIVISRPLADALYGKGVPVVGKRLMDANIIGVVAPAMVSYVSPGYVKGMVLLPRFINTDVLTYVMRVKPGQRDNMMLQVPQLLRKLNASRVITEVQSVSALKNRSYRRDISMVKMLTVTMSLVLTVTGLGIVGLTLLWGNQRRRQIGIRRALGATRSAIMRYFLTENLIITAIGVVFGSLLSLLLNQLMINHYHMGALPLSYLALSVMFVLLLGLIAALVPAWRSSQVSPALATRSV